MGWVFSRSRHLIIIWLNYLKQPQEIKGLKFCKSSFICLYFFWENKLLMEKKYQRRKSLESFKCLIPNQFWIKITCDLLREEEIKVRFIIAIPALRVANPTELLCNKVLIIGNGCTSVPVWVVARLPKPKAKISNIFLKTEQVTSWLLRLKKKIKKR